MSSTVAMYGFLAVAAIAIFTFVSVAGWATARKRERDAFYKSQLMQKILDKEGHAAVLAYLEAEGRLRKRREAEAMKSSGIVTAAAGAGIMLFFGSLKDAPGVWALGAIPFLVGVALTVCGFVFTARKEEESR